MNNGSLVDSSGSQIQLGPLIGKGGEASVYEVLSERGLVAKIYHKCPDSRKTQKLVAMSALSNDRLTALSAWPLKTIHSARSRDLVGVLMRNVAGFKDVHFLYNPKSRFREFPRATWPFIIHAATNIARAFDVLHAHRIVVGDVNEKNIKVAPDTAITTLIDCDSFQVSDGARNFLCEVGVPTYTPPELQGQAFATVIRTPNHDNFGLAIMIFQMLFMGRHPFAGRFSGRGDMPIEKAIQEFRFAFGPDALNKQMQPPPNSLTLAEISPDLARLFVMAFSQSGVHNGRPPAAQWVQGLDRFKQELRPCTNNPAHNYFKALGSCPWCLIETRSGIVFFFALGVLTSSATNIDQIWRRILAIPDPGPPPNPGLPQLIIIPSPAAHENRRKRIWRVLSAFGFCAAVLLLVTAIGSGWWILIIAIIVGFIVVNKANQTRVAFEREYRSTEAQFRAVEERWKREAGNSSFKAMFTEVEGMRNEYLRIPALQSQKLQELERNKYSTQLHRFLDRYSIRTADIPKIGPGRKAMLSSYGIDTADDITATAVQNVPGFGPTYTANLLAWRRSIESRFVFRPTEPVDPEEVKKIEQEIEGKKCALERRMTAGYVELQKRQAQILGLRKSMADDLSLAYRNYLQAQANWKAA